MKFTLKKFGSNWHACLDVGGERFVQWAERGPVAAWLVYRRAEATLGRRYVLSGKLESHCRCPDCYKPPFPF